MFRKGPLFFTLVTSVMTWGIILGLQNWTPTYQGHFLFNVESPMPTGSTVTGWMQKLQDSPKIKQVLKSEEELKTQRLKNPYFYAQWQLNSIVNPWAQSRFLTRPITQDHIASRIKRAVNIAAVADSAYSVQLQDSNLQLLNTILAELPLMINQDQNSTSVQNLQDVTFSNANYLNLKDWTFKIGLTISVLLGLILTYKWTTHLSNLEEEELRMTFPFSVLGLLPKLNDNTSPTVTNDAFELLRTNISMQRSIFSFSSLTLIWPFDKSAQNDFLTRLACDFGKTNKKVLVIETTAHTLSKQYACENHKGLTDLHTLIKESAPQSEKENEVFWKMYEYVFGTEDKFYFMPFGQSEVAESILFEKYNFRRLLNVLKKHFSLLILNAPNHLDVTNTLPWTTVNDATLLVANYKNNASVADKDQLKIISCAQRFLLGGILLDVPLEAQSQQILKYDIQSAARAS